MIELVFDRVENIVGKEENACCQYFLLFHELFSKGFFLRVIKTQDFFGKDIKGFRILMNRMTFSVGTKRT